MADRHIPDILSILEQSRNLLDASLRDEALVSAIAEAAEMMTQALGGGRKIMLAGNGGSAADAQHIAGEIVGRFNFDRAPLPALALTVDSSVLTAIANDYGVAHIYERQVRGLGQSGDIFFGISTSGTSRNILAALQVARQMGVRTVGMTGASGDAMAEFCDVVLRVPSRRTPLVQQVHITIGHILCSIAEERIFGAEKKL